MSKNLDQIYETNPITTNADTDLMYFGQSPYGVGDDAAMTYANFKAQFGAAYTASALTTANDTNVTITMSGTPATALLEAVELTMGWSGTLSGARGGTGINNGSSTITVPGNFALTGGAYTFTGTLAGNTAVTFPTSGFLATTAQIPTGAALTEVSDTNIVLTLGGSPGTAVLNATSITASWSGTLSGTRGGTGVNNGASTITVAGNFSMSGAFTFNGMLSGNTSVTFPTSGTLVASGSSPQFTNVEVTGFISGSDGNEVIKPLDNVGAVNWITLENATTGNACVIAATGGDTNVELLLEGAGNAGVGIQGVSTNNNALSGFVGEYISQNVPFASPVSLVTSTAKTMTSITLTAGDYDVGGNIFWSIGGTCTGVTGAISTTNNTLPTDSSNWMQFQTSAVLSSAFPTPTVRITTASTITVYIVAFATFSTSTVGVSGNIWARRRR